MKTCCSKICIYISALMMPFQIWKLAMSYIIIHPYTIREAGFWTEWSLSPLIWRKYHPWFPNRSSNICLTTEQFFSNLQRRPRNSNKTQLKPDDKVYCLSFIRNASAIVLFKKMAEVVKHNTDNAVFFSGFHINFFLRTEQFYIFPSTCFNKAIISDFIFFFFNYFLMPEC